MIVYNQFLVRVPSWLTIDSIVLLKNVGHPLSGTVKYIGYVPGFDPLIVGLELVCFDTLKINNEFLMLDDFIAG